MSGLRHILSIVILWRYYVLASCLAVWRCFGTVVGKGVVYAEFFDLRHTVEESWA